MFSMFPVVNRVLWEKAAQKTLKNRTLRSLDWSYDPYLVAKPYYDQQASQAVFPQHISHALTKIDTKNLLYWHAGKQEALKQLLPFCQGIVAEHTAIAGSQKTWQESLKKIATHAPLVLRLHEDDRTHHRSFSPLTEQKMKHTWWLWDTKEVPNRVHNTPPPGCKDLSIDLSTVFHKGAPPTLQVAYLSAQLVAHIHQFLSKTAKPASFFSFLERFFLIVPIEGDYFHQIAKLRAIRWHIDSILRSYCEKESTANEEGKAYTLPILSISGLLNKTLMAPHTNMIRNTAEAMSAVLGGTEALAILPFEVRNNTTSNFLSQRNALNTLNVLRHESDINLATQDPITGSYFLESLIHSMGVAAWKVFQNICKKGGITTPAGRHYFDEEMRTATEKKWLAVRKSHPLWVGINAFVSVEKTIPHACSPATAGTYVATYAGGRQKKEAFYPAPYEQLHQRSTLFFMEKNIEKPVLFISLQTIKMREAAREVFALLGIESTPHIGVLKAAFLGKPKPIGWVWMSDKNTTLPPLSTDPLLVLCHGVGTDKVHLSTTPETWLKTAEKIQGKIEDATHKFLQQTAG